MALFADPTATSKKTVIYVGGLADEVDEQTLTAAFRPFGDLQQVLLPKDASTQRHRGFGFVVFQDPSDAQAALDNMSDSELYGRVLKCNLAKPGAAGAAGGARTGGAIWAGEAADEFYGNVPKSAEAVDAAIMHAQNQDAKARAAAQQQ